MPNVRIVEQRSPAPADAGVPSDAASPGASMPSAAVFDFPSLRAIHPERTAKKRRRGAVGGLAKRLFDIAVSGAALAVLSPLLLLIAALVVTQSTGPALFLQRRGGYRGRTFLIFKFRTMTTMEDDKKVGQAVRNDSRVTPIGAFLRKASLDELPQLLNVLRGEMSIVGPRPHAVAHDENFAKIDPGYRRRTAARPGITGLAQVSGCRGPIETTQDVHDRVRFDTQYVDTWSLWLDIKIIVRTALLVFRDDRAF
jgi:putative colanic acid biosynthesis UDP-glucose lipid carrier transferase